MAATTEAERDAVLRDNVLHSSTLLALLCLHGHMPRHRFPTATGYPVGLLAEDSWIGLAPFLTDVFPLWPVVKALAVNTLAVGTLLVCVIVMVHNNPPFRPPVFIGAIYHYKSNSLFCQ